MTPEELAAYKAKDATYSAKSRANMTPEEKAADTRAIRAARAREKTLKNKNKKK
jgi:hypothetical protein